MTQHFESSQAGLLLELLRLAALSLFLPPWHTPLFYLWLSFFQCPFFILPLWVCHSHKAEYKVKFKGFKLEILTIFYFYFIFLEDMTLKPFSYIDKILPALFNEYNLSERELELSSSKFTKKHQNITKIIHFWSTITAVL